MIISILLSNVSNRPFPKLMLNKSDGSIVLFKKSNDEDGYYGMVVKSGKLFEVGNYGKWTISNMADINCEILLKQE